MHYVSLAVLIIAILFAFLYAGLTGSLFTAAVAALTYSATECKTTTAAVTALFALLYVMMGKRYLEPFEDAKKQAKAVEKAVKPAKKEPFGLYPASLEGFEDLQPQEEKEGAASSSTAAPSKVQPAVDSDHVAEVTKAVKESKVAKEEFESATGTLFKQGQMPSEHADGPKLDAGTTIKKAMENFDADAVSNMTSDTKDLLQTQKKLMDMLVQMRPVLSDGKELLETFSGMFGGTGMSFGRK